MGLPPSLRTGIESLSGIAMNDVRVHRNSSKPRQLNALAYTQGTDIHVAPGQEHHLPHEAWHVVQQKQGRVRPTMQMKGKGINDSADLEHEANDMGARALRMTGARQPRLAHSGGVQSAVTLQEAAHSKGCGCPGCSGNGPQASRSAAAGLRDVSGETKPVQRAQCGKCFQHNGHTKDCPNNKNNKKKGGGKSAKARAQSQSDRNANTILTYQTPNKKTVDQTVAAARKFKGNIAHRKGKKGSNKSGKTKKIIKKLNQGGNK
ncbi:MAG: DUF4157 domain-containing protein [Thermoanaerobaculia bacterium]